MGAGSGGKAQKILTGGMPSILVPMILDAIKKPEDTPPPPEAEKPTEMPDAEAQQAAVTDSIRQQLSRRGRTSTILTDQREKLG